MFFLETFMKREFVNRGLLVLAVLALGAGRGFSQNYRPGAIFDRERYNSLPWKAARSAGASVTLPEAVSLKAYAPVPGDQGDYGTSVAWASAYAARTISESIALNRRNRTETTRGAFSPAFVYRMISDDPECRSGAEIYRALDAMKAEGAAKMLDLERIAGFEKIGRSFFDGRRRYPISDYAALFRRSGDWLESDGVRVQAVKKSLSEGKPVIIGMNCPPSLITAEEVWRPRENPDDFYGGHAMCVVGYDDNRDGGAFEAQNSWGRGWGKGGYVWIPYDVFSRFVLEAYEIIENLRAYEDTVRFSGYARLEFYGREGELGFRLDPDGFYRTAQPYPSGTEFRFHLGNREPAYVYVFMASDRSPETFRFFPDPESGESPVLDYADSMVSWPGEYQSIRLEGAPGTEYIVALFSKRALDIAGIQRRFESAPGNLVERAARAVGADYLPFNPADYGADEIRFNAQSAGGDSVFGLLLAIEHRPQPGL
jgi:hypothetical protein